MKLITLIENTPGAEGCLYEHGLSIYAETADHKILLDTGASAAFLKNAEILGIDLTQVDMLILSHGHYDHAGGIMDFVKINAKSPIYMREAAIKEYYHLTDDGKKYIGIDKRIRELSQVVFTKEWERLDEHLYLFSDVNERKLWPEGNKKLKCLKNGGYEQDIFDHEQSLVLQENGKSILISGCAHNGILNILEKYQEIFHELPDVVITGFHMKKNTPLTMKEKEVVAATAEALKKFENTIFYSGHCTGTEAFDIMKQIMGSQLKALHSGDYIINLPEP